MQAYRSSLFRNSRPAAELHEQLARATSALAQALRYNSLVARADKELIILRAARLTHGNYPSEQHRPMAMSCGISAAQTDGLSEWRNNNLFSDRQCVVLAFANGMASAAGVDDATFDAMNKYFSSQEIVELTMNAAYYTSARRSAARCAIGGAKP